MWRHVYRAVGVGMMGLLAFGTMNHADGESLFNCSLVSYETCGGGGCTITIHYCYALPVPEECSNPDPPPPPPPEPCSGGCSGSCEEELVPGPCEGVYYWQGTCYT